DFIVGFKTYPHVDMYETGEHVARIMAGVLEGEVTAKQGFAHPPILAQALRMNTNVPGSMKKLVDKARELEKQKHIHAVTFFGGFPLSDLAETGTSVVIVAEDSEIAQRVATEFAADVWAERKGFVYHERP